MKGARQRKVALPEKIVKMGGVCEEVEKFGSLYREQENLDALKHQLQFNKKVLKSEGIKELLQMTTSVDKATKNSEKISLVGSASVEGTERGAPRRDVEQDYTPGVLNKYMRSSRRRCGIGLTTFNAETDVTRPFHETLPRGTKTNVAMAASNATVRMRLAHAKETVPDWLSGSSTSLQNGCYYGAGLIRSAAFLRSVELGIDRMAGLWFDERKLQYFNYRLSRARMVVEGALGMLKLKGRRRCPMKRMDLHI
ncbi:hypothetical protein Bbelb_282520 [Branchiostoma belcheri]|nr:hypothetical protein Bbelb_282520 [Branchiostoma belcheri]